MEIIKNYKKEKLDWPIIIGCLKGQRNILNDLFDEETNKYLDEIDLLNNEIKEVYTFGKYINKKIYLVGLSDEANDSDYRKIFNKISKLTERNIIIDLDSFKNNTDVASICIYELCYGSYVFNEYKSEKKDKDLTIKLFSSVDVSNEIEEALNIANAINNARDLINQPYNHLSVIELAQYSLNLVKELNNDKLSIRIYNKKEIEEMKMEAFLGVNKGSKEEPKLICLKYQGLDVWENITCLVGKGIMFDTGGYSLKTSMNNMKSDMAGAATVLSVLECVVKNNLKCNIQVVIAATDNRINGEALLPDDILTAANGKTIEIVSTDAEGRLTLADAIWFAQKEGCKEIIDVATLTGACVVALGEYTTGVFGNNKDKINKFLECSIKENESSWELPITEVIRAKVRGSKVADLTNSTGRYMGASGAAAFLEAFVEKDVNWIHLDIAGTAFHTSPNEFEVYGATGTMVRTIYRYVKER